MIFVDLIVDVPVVLQPSTWIKSLIAPSFNEMTTLGKVDFPGFPLVGGSPRSAGRSLPLIDMSNGNISFVLMVNKQGQTRLASYYDWMSVPQRVQLEGEIIRRCITRPPEACQILQIRGYNVVYRRY